MSRSKGFTLVEIMIVVAIIGILIAIAVPGFLKARETSRATSCSENMGKIAAAVEQYILDTKCPDWATAVGTDYLGGTLPTDWSELVGADSYLRHNPVCPSSGTYVIWDGTVLVRGFVATSDAPVACTTGHAFPGEVVEGPGPQLE
ncbi:prepilin-type N-terminal cleavage/methylation domain-containing protein [Candidatus Poribacteria bacterium]|nr:prepilin-type N-terminal cleavage/methylation domain-containing protein [Candidatus Poribacteria bacterium]